MIHLKQLPLIIKLRKIMFEKKFSNHINVNYFRGVYNSFEEAIKASPKTKPIGYDNEESAKLYKERVKQIYSTDYPVLFWMNKYKSEIKKVFDFGGHIGVHYYSYSKYLESSQVNKWTICDVTSVVEEAKKLAIKNNAAKLDFTTSALECNGYDLFFASGSLQYLDWELGDQLMKINSLPKFIIVNMLPLHDKLSTITLQSIGNSFCPYYVRKKDDFITNLNDLGYEIIDTWKNESKKCNIAFEAERSLDFYTGMFFKLNTKI